MITIDLFFQTTNREGFLADLQALQLTREGVLLSNPLQSQLLPIEGLELDYLGPLVSVPAEYDTSAFPPVEITPAVLFAGERANLRLTGPQAEARAALLAGVSLAHSTLLAPADVPPAQIRWAGGGTPWTGQAEIPAPPPSPVPEALPAAKTRLLARLAQRRWEAETGGVILGGLTLLTDDRSKLMLLGAAEQARRNPAWTTRWKAGSGWVDLTAEQVLAAAEAVAEHVQSCFALEAAIAEQIQAAETPEALAALTTVVEVFAIIVP